jgi:histidinol-phosphatase (PHP family)
LKFHQGEIVIVDLHNHTPLCRHAVGTPMQYLERALELGCKYYGFSDHAPMDFDPNYRMKMDQMETYEAWIKEAKDAYGSKINILLGYEIDYLEGYIDERVLARECDYRIGSVHFLGEWGFDNPEFIGHFHDQDIDLIWKRYFDAITAMAKSNLFDIVGHLDLIKIFKFLPKADVRSLAKEALDAIKDANMVVEINTAGFRKPIGEQYPSLTLLREVAAREIPITFCSDAHAPEQVGFKVDKAIELAKSLGYRKCAIFSNREREMINF